MNEVGEDLLVPELEIINTASTTVLDANSPVTQHELVIIQMWIWKTGVHGEEKHCPGVIMEQQKLNSES